MIFQPTYFPNIASFQIMLEAKELVFEIQDNFKKQTYRTRCHLYSANGLLSMNIPIKHQKTERQLTKDVRIENDFPWQKSHLRTWQNAYRSSPYFEFYEDELIQLYQTKETFLLDFLFSTIDLSFKLLQSDTSYQKTGLYQKVYPQLTDFRELADAKKSHFPEVKKYTQVFDAKHGFIPNLSILDLLFNEGPNALYILK